MNSNYQKRLEQIILKMSDSDIKPSLLLHSCCAPCSSYCLEYLAEYFDITVFYYNPNITSKEEYDMRVGEQKRLIAALSNELCCDIKFLEGSYDSAEFLERVKGYEDCKEGGERCKICFDMRLDQAALIAKTNKFDYFTTTLTISPLKNADILNSIGEDKGKKYGVEFLPSDFKKKNGYKRSIELSAKYSLYRQNYCGCAFSKREADERNNLKNRENSERN